MPYSITQYDTLVDNILHWGVDVKNPRTGKICKTAINQTIRLYGDEFPILVKRKINWKAAIGEMLCYMRAYQSLEDFHLLGVKTWDANCKAWQPFDANIKVDDNDCGLIYGASAQATGIGFKDIIKQLQDPETRHDRGIIWNFWNPAYFHMACLRPCMMTHQFTVLGDALHLTSYQRSADVPLGLAFNMIQAWFLLNVAAKLSGLHPGSAYLHITNAHIYEDQIPAMREYLGRDDPQGEAEFVFKKDITTEDIMQNIDASNIDDFFEVRGYQHSGVLKIPFTV